MKNLFHKIKGKDNIKEKGKENKLIKDIRLVSVKKNTNNKLEFLLTENIKIEKIYIVNENKYYNMEFYQKSHVIYLNLQIPNELICDEDTKYNVYFLSEFGPLRPFLPNAQTIDSKMRNFDIESNGDVHGYIYFSKSYKRAMLQLKKQKIPNLIKKMKISKKEAFSFSSFKLNDSYIDLFFDWKKDFGKNYKIILERGGKWQVLQTEWLVGSVRGYFDESVLANMAPEFGYTVRFLCQSDVNDDVIYELMVNGNKNFQLMKYKNHVYSFIWNTIENLRFYSSNDGKSRLLYPDGTFVNNIYLEYKERPVFKKINIIMEDDGWIKTDIDITKDNSMYKGIYTVYQNDTSRILGSFNKINDLQEAFALPNKLNVLAKVQDKQLFFFTEQATDIINVWVTFKENKKMYLQNTSINSEFQFSLKNNNIKNINDIIFEYYTCDEKIRYKSVSKISDIIVMENGE